MSMYDPRAGSPEEYARIQLAGNELGDLMIDRCVGYKIDVALFASAKLFALVAIEYYGDEAIDVAPDMIRDLIKQIDELRK